ncbi:hypothetical protein Tco_1010231 [Tanacetum coccineum]
MIQYLEKSRTLIHRFKAFSIEKVLRSENRKADALSKIAYTNFTHLTKQVLVEILKEKSISEKDILTVVKEEGYTWMTLLLDYLIKGTLLAEGKKLRTMKIKNGRDYNYTRISISNENTMIRDGVAIYGDNLRRLKLRRQDFGDGVRNYEEIDGGFVAFRGDPKGGKITGKGKISTCKLDFEDVYFVKELKFNLFSVSQMCDKKNSVLFTDTECVILSHDFKLLDENHVLLRVPRKDNMYNVDLKNIVSS